LDLSKASLRLDSEVLTYELTENGQLDVQENYKVKRGPLTSSHYGVWTEGLGLEVPEPSKWLRRNNLGGVHLKTVMQEWYPIAFPTVANENQWNGLFPEALLSFLADLNVTLEYVTSIDGKWGGKENQSSSAGSGEPVYNGMVGMLQRKEVDMCNAGLTVTPGRAEVIDFSLGLIVDH
jgi:hypothetical protein